MSHFALRPCVLFLSLFITLSFSSKAQSFEISSDVCDSLTPTSFLMHVSGYATFTDSMIMTIELITADSLKTVVYSASKDFGVGGANTLTNFTIDPVTELFSLDIGNYTTNDYIIHIISKENGVFKEELFIHTL
ncbi:MAG: hypothetical protein HRT58_22045 [Crocinitomicaceae bacterium]|nr:hypothetical protein [Flavobacteriales bacterium]NQZ38358.1 hypothetical protein [Crocinitomicaceae bacterium]